MIGYCTYFFQYFVRSIIAGVEFLIRFQSQGTKFVWLHFQEHSITNLELQLPYILVSVFFHPLSGFGEVILQFI